MEFNLGRPVRVGGRAVADREAVVEATGASPTPNSSIGPPGSRTRWLGSLGAGDHVALLHAQHDRARGVDLACYQLRAYGSTQLRYGPAELTYSSTMRTSWRGPRRRVRPPVARGGWPRPPGQTRSRPGRPSTRCSRAAPGPVTSALERGRPLHPLHRGTTGCPRGGVAPRGLFFAAMGGGTRAPAITARATRAELVATGPSASVRSSAAKWARPLRHLSMVAHARERLVGALAPPRWRNPRPRSGTRTRRGRVLDSSSVNTCACSRSRRRRGRPLADALEAEPSRWDLTSLRLSAPAGACSRDVRPASRGGASILAILEGMVRANRPRRLCGPHASEHGRLDPHVCGEGRDDRRGRRPAPVAARPGFASGSRRVAASRSGTTRTPNGRRGRS